MDRVVAVSNSAWIELLHAEVCWLLKQADIRALIIKGEATRQWLYRDAPGDSVDVDVLVHPDSVGDAIGALKSHGFADTYTGVAPRELAGHSHDLQRKDPSHGLHGVDLHLHIPGIDADPDAAFETLWARRQIGHAAGVQVAFPDTAAMALILALHCAREPGSAKALHALETALEQSDLELWSQTRDLAADLQATPALVAGLRGDPKGLLLFPQLGLADVEVGSHWDLIATGSTRTALRLDDLLNQPWRYRPALLARWAFPSPALMRMRDRRARTGPVGLTVAYANRLAHGIRELPGSLRTARAARRR